MRVVLLCSIVPILAFSLACGGAPKPVAADPSDTASLESSPTTTHSAAHAAQDESAAPSASPTATATATPSPAVSSSESNAPPASNHPVPASTGNIDGKPFAPKMAHAIGPLQKDGRRLVVLREGTECVAPGDAKPGEASMMLMVPWSDGYKVDIASLKRAKGNNLGEAAFVRVGADKKKQVSASFRPTGLVTVVSAPTREDAVGKLKIDLQNGDYMLVGDLDVRVCVAAK